MSVEIEIELHLINYAPNSAPVARCMQGARTYLFLLNVMGMIVS